MGHKSVVTGSCWWLAWLHDKHLKSLTTRTSQSLLRVCIQADLWTFCLGTLGATWFCCCFSCCCWCCSCRRISPTSPPVGPNYRSARFRASSGWGDPLCRCVLLNPTAGQHAAMAIGMATVAGLPDFQSMQRPQGATVQAGVCLGSEGGKSNREAPRDARERHQRSAFKRNGTTERRSVGKSFQGKTWVENKADRFVSQTLLRQQANKDEQEGQTPTQPVSEPTLKTKRRRADSCRPGQCD